MNPRWAAYAAYANSLAALAQLLTSGGDPKANGVMGVLNNASGVVWAASFVPVAYLFYRASRTHATIVSAAVLAFGVVAFGAATFLEIATATGQLTFVQETVAYYPVLGGIGVWLLMAEGVALMETDLPRTPLVFGAVIGALWFFANVLFGAGGLPSPTAEGSINDLTDSGILVLETAFLLQPFWGLWLGRSLLVPPPTRTPAAR
ncbi:MAG TPA: hypothetical protein VGS17_10595 [Candidatus Limnocylindria bacterium]|nr:hypothetical protein [Candidatus Limnocylindria bacterium]